MSIKSNFPTIRPTLLLDFVNTRGIDPRITFTRASSATRINERGVLESVAVGVPRLDFDPVTLACKGWLIEESRTNYIPNNTMQGVVTGSPGTTPTGWAVAGTGGGITRTVVATGEEDGISYVDIRFNGTPTENNVSFGLTGANAVAAASGQAWALSTYLRLVGGSFANTALGLLIVETDGTTAIASSLGPCVATGAPLVTQRFVYAATLSNAWTSHVQPRLRVGLTIDQPIDFTLRIGLPQLEPGGFATSVIRTTGAAATRAADVPVMTGSNFSSWYRQDEGTFVVESSTSARTATDKRIISVNNGTVGHNMNLHYGSSSGGIFASVITTSGVFQFGPAESAYAADEVSKRALAYINGNPLVATNGVTFTHAGASATVVPTGLDRLEIGCRVGAQQLNGHIRRIAYYPKRLANAELQALTTP